MIYITNNGINKTKRLLICKKPTPLMVVGYFFIGMLVCYYRPFLRLSSFSIKPSSLPVCPATEVFSCALLVR